MEYLMCTVLLIGITFPHLGSALNCYGCQQSDDPHSCNNTVKCGFNEVCFLEHKAGFYNMGCADSNHRGGVANVVDREVRRQTSTKCLEYCSSDRCNSELCNLADPALLCIDDPSMDCAKLNSLFHVCQDVNQAKLTCPKFCKLCTIVDGGWSSWSSWGSCSVTFGIGLQIRTRACSNPRPGDNGQHCFGDSRDERVCLLDGNVVIDGGWTNWGNWEACSSHCDGGFRARTRSCSNPLPSSTGRQCVGSAHQMESCNEFACADGGWSSWGGWGPCSDSCGGGVKTRQRSCTYPRPSLLGRICAGNSEDVSICNTQTCPEKQVAFLATGSNKAVFHVFQNTIYNIGNGYNNNTGKFISPIPGLYYFSSTMTKEYSVHTDQVVCYLAYVEKHMKIGANNNPESFSEDRSGYSITMSGIFHLRTNDSVHVLCLSGATALDNGGDYCSFTGFLVSPDN